MNEGHNEHGRGPRGPPDRQRQHNGPRPRQNNVQQRKQPPAAAGANNDPESPPTYVRRDPGTQHQPKCQDTAPLPPLQLELVKQVWLEANFFMVLEKRSVQHPNAQFYCKLCNYYCMSFNHCEQHVKDAKHDKNVKAEAKLTTLQHLPEPTPGHFDAISNMLFNLFKKHGLMDAEKQARLDYAAQVNTLISTEMPGCQVRAYGSSLTGIAVKKSDLNLDFVIAKELTPPDMLQKAFEVLSASSLAVDVESDFNGDIPSISFKDVDKVHSCVLNLTHHDATSTCKLVEMYTKLDPRVKPLGCCFRYWAKLCRIDNIEMAMLPSYSYSLLLIYYLQQVEPPVLPVIEDFKEDEVPEWNSENKMSIGELWYRMFKFYATEFTESKNIVCIRLKEPLTKVKKQWTSRKIAIEDPNLQKRNVSRYLVSVTYDHIMKCFTNTYEYFAVPQTDLGPLIGIIKQPLEKFLCLPEVKLNIVRAEQSAIDMMDKDPARFVKSSEGKKVYSVDELERGVANTALNEERKLDYGFYANRIVSPNVAKALCLRLKKDAFRFEFNTRSFAQEHPVVCNICQLEGHTRLNCPDIYLPPLEDLPVMHSKFLRELDTICKKEMENWLPSDEEVHERQSFVQDLQAHLQRKYQNVKLELFGSSCNGFGFRKSDLDICLTFTDNPTGQGINDVALIEELGNELKTCEQLSNLLTITTAKVPIIKFTYPRIRVECDISLYNTLAQRNTQMLHFYTQIDPRVKILGFTLKRFAKLCDICDASRGSLSSYAYILMAIYFLQQCNPPVIPVLQELYKGDTQPKLMVEGWNTWFFDDLENLSEMWPEYGKNTTSVGELWYQLLRFYTEEFNFNDFVVSIKQKAKLGRFQKLWTSKCIAIEDPFDLNHNLGSGLSRKMNNFIIKTFRKGRMHFGTPVTAAELVPPYKEVREYLFDARFLTDGAVPNDRGCRICKKIGHLARNCPRSQQQQRINKNQKPNNAPPRQPPHRKEHERPLPKQPMPQRMQMQQHQQQHHQEHFGPGPQQMKRPPMGQMGQHQQPPFPRSQQQQQQPLPRPQQQQQAPRPQQQPRPQLPPQQVNGDATPSPPLPQSPTKNIPANSSPAFDNFMRLMQGRGAAPIMQVPPGFAPQPQPPQQHQQQQRLFFHPQQQPPQQQQHPHMFQGQSQPPNGVRPVNQFYYSGAPLTQQQMWPGGMMPQQPQSQGAPLFPQHQQQLPQGMMGGHHPQVGSQQQQ